MKKLLTLLILSLTITIAHAQFFQGWGFFVGATAGRQYWHHSSFDSLPNPNSKEKLNFLLRYNGEIFFEFIDNPTFRWVTEVQYNVKGSKMKNPTPNDLFLGYSSGTKFVNQYAAWNNYLMIRKEMFAIIPYAKIGPRLEYVFSSPQGFKKFHVTGALGAGIEFVAYGPVKFITEAWWVPDLTKSYSLGFDPTIKQHCWELRVGLKFAPRGGSCPKALTYN
jgi:hypothetical protein